MKTAIKIIDLLLIATLVIIGITIGQLVLNEAHKSKVEPTSYIEQPTEVINTTITEVQDLVIIP